LVYKAIKSAFYSTRRFMGIKRGFEKISNERWILDSYGHLHGDNTVALPTRKTIKSAGYDIPSTLPFSLEPDEEILIPLGFKVYMEEDDFFQIHPRSGSGFKFYVRLANTTGIVDSDYYNNPDNEGHCWCKLRNEGYKTWHVEFGEGIAQGIFSKYLTTDDDSQVVKTFRSGGFGSTDSK
jgi:dUTP pyrophosphatase